MATITVMQGNRQLPNQLKIGDKPAHIGGEGNIYFTSDRRYAVKIYHRPSPDKHQLLQYVLDLGKNLGAEEQFLAWPLGIVERMNGQARVGVVTRAVAPAYLPLHKLIYSPVEAVEQFRQGKSWLEYLKIARGAAAAVRTINGKGMAHADIHLKNFLARPDSGEVVLIDLDGLVVKGFLPPQVKGAAGFIAPEVISSENEPNELSDRYSIAVLVLWILLLRNVMQAHVCYDDQDAINDDVLGYGKFACFSENTDDRRNWIARVGTPLFREGALSYLALTPRLQELTCAALINGLHQPTDRPQAVAWERALAEAYDLLVMCAACRQSFFYPYQVQPPRRRQCPFCGQRVQPPFPIVAELLEERAKGSYVPVRPIVLYDHLPLFADIAAPGSLPPFTRRGLATIGRTAWDARKRLYVLVNESDRAWSTADGTVPRGGAVSLHRGTLVAFGDRQRLLRVVE